MNAYAIAAIVIAGVIGVGSAIAYHEVSISKAYERGYTKGETDQAARSAAAIAAMKKAALENSVGWSVKTPTEKTTELQKRCVAACEGEPKCEAACKQ